MSLGDGHPDGVGNALPEGPSGHLYPGGDEVLGVTGGQGVELPEALQVVHRDAVPGRMPNKTMIGEKQRKKKTERRGNVLNQLVYAL